MTIRKIKASLVKEDVDVYVGEYSYIFYDIDTGSLRLYDGTPGGLPLLGGGGTPGGVDGDIQVNVAGAFGTIAGFTVDANTFSAGNYTFNIDQVTGAGQNGYALIYDNATGEISLAPVTATAAGANDEIQFNSGGALSSNANFTFTTTLLTAGNFLFNIDQTVGAGQDNYILTYDNGTGEIGLEVNSPSWGDIIGNVTDNTDLTDYITAATEEEMFAQEVDFVTNSLIYRAEAQPGTATSAASWRIRKITINNASLGDVSITWADGNDNFDNIWDDRAILTYS